MHKVLAMAEAIDRVVTEEAGGDTAVKIGVLITTIARIALAETGDDPVAARIYVGRAVTPSIDEMIDNLLAIRDIHARRRG